MATEGKIFFRFTRDLKIKSGETASFLWASYSGLRKVYDLGSELSKLNENPDWRRIERHIVGDIPVFGGIDLKKIVKADWTTHEAKFAESILTEGAMLYEDWCQDMAAICTSSAPKIKAETFQFPSAHASQKFSSWSVLDVAVASGGSEFLRSKVQSSLLTKYAKNIYNLNALLLWYRFFKEIRNSVVHSGGIARDINVITYNAASATPLGSIGPRRNYGGSVPVLGERIQLDVSDAVLFLSIILHISLAFDAKYCYLLDAEQDLEGRVQEYLNKFPPAKELTILRQEAWASRFFATHLGVVFTPPQAALTWLTQKGLVSIRTI